MAALHPAIERVTGELLDGLAGRDDVVDLVGEFAFPFATAVPAELPGVPEDERDEFARWVPAVVDGAEAAPDRAGLRAVVDHLARSVAARRGKPSGPAGPDESPPGRRARTPAAATTFGDTGSQTPDDGALRRQELVDEVGDHLIGSWSTWFPGR